MSQTWTLVNSSENFDIVNCYRNGQTTVTNGQHVIGMSGFNNSTKISDNYGSTFSNSNINMRFRKVVSTYINSTTQIVYGYNTDFFPEKSYIYKSTDGGNTFTNILNLNEKVYDISIDGNGILQLVKNNSTGGGGQGLYKYNTQLISVNQQITIYNSCKILVSYDGLKVYIFNENSPYGNIYISNDSGISFTSYTLPDSNINSACCNSSGSILYFTSYTYNLVYKSINNGVNWNSINVNTNATEQLGNIETDSTGNIIIVLSNGSSFNNVGVYLSTNAGVIFIYTNISSISASGYVAISSNGADIYACFSVYNSISSVYYYNNSSTPPTPSTSPIICFHESTKILTNQGYRPIRDLRKGDQIQTVDHGYVPIELIGHRVISHPANTYDRIKDQLYLCSRSKYPALFEDLIITGCHSILVKQFDSQEQRDKTERLLGDIYVTDNHYRLPACLDDRADVYDKPGDYTIYHFALENADYYMNYGVYANGLLVESSSRRFMHELAQMVLVD
jgi:hypothetical protein